MRTLVVWCPDWPVIAAEIVDGWPAHAPVAVLYANRVLASSPAARAEGVRRGLRKREAQGRCPHLIVLEHDPGRDARAFEPVLAAVEELAPGVETLRPGVCALAARGPTRYFGGEATAAEHIVEHVAQRCHVEAQIGIAEGTFAAGLAARAGRIIPAGESAEFLAGLSIAALGRPPLVDLLRRLGIHTLGDFAALPAGDVLARFGFDAALAHRLAGGQDERPLAPRQPPPDLDVTEQFDEPVERVDAAAFAARGLAERLHARLASHGLACTRLAIEARTANGEELHRTWRHDGLLSAAAIADRVRWQLDGWLTGTSRRAADGRIVADGGGVVYGGGGRSSGAAADGGSGGGGRSSGAAADGGGGTFGGRQSSAVADGRSGVFGGRQSSAGVDGGVFGGGGRSSGIAPTAGIAQLRLVPEGVIAHVGLQPGLWGEAGEERDRAHRALTRVQGLLGPEAVLTPVLDGGRVEADRVRLVPWGDERLPTRPVEPPWPGRLPAPAPATVYGEPRPATVLSAAGEPVGVTGRLAVSAPPARIAITDEPRPVDVVAWAGPWPVDERWWAAEEAHRCARFQLHLADGRALLVVLDGGRWAVEANYD